MSQALRLILSFSVLLAQAARASEPVADAARKIATEVTAHATAYRDLVELTSRGHRLCGSPEAEAAVGWAKAKLASYGFDRVVAQPVQVPRWTRGTTERAEIVTAGERVPVKVTALGGSVGASAIEAQVVEVKSLDEVAALGASVKGKIVLYNRAMDPSLPDTFDAYRLAADQRVAGASQGARFGAVAVLNRSLTTLADDDHPHTGMVHYAPNVAKIPAAAISAHGANVLSAALKRDPGLKLRLDLSCGTHGMVESHNVFAELRGREKPDEYVVVGGHLDSWDLATGAHDDGAGVVQSIETLRALKAAGLRPRRTVRAVLYMCEEVGSFGGKEYAKEAKRRGEKHVAALESDRGGFAPVGFDVEENPAALKAAEGFRPYLEPLKADRIRKGGGGSDISPLKELGTALFGFVPESRHYFDYHHSMLDTIDKVKAEELHASAAAMAVFTYLLAETSW